MNNIVKNMYISFSQSLEITYYKDGQSYSKILN